MKSAKTSICFLLLLSSVLIANIPSRAEGAPSGNVYGEELTGLPFSPRNVDVDSAGRIYVGTGSEGVWRSDDRGATWTRINKTSGAVLSIYVDSRDYVYAQIGSIIYRSTNRGISWTLSFDASGHSQWWMWDEDSKGNIYANNYYVGTGTDYIYRSTDEGETFHIWYDLSASPNPVRHIHSVDVAPNDYVFVTTGDSDAVGGYYDDNTIRRFNGTDWEILAQSTSATDQEPRAIAIWFMNGYAHANWDVSKYMYRFPITGTWAQRDRILLTAGSLSGAAGMYDAIIIDGMAFLSSSTGFILASWDGVHFVKVFHSPILGPFERMSSRKSFPLYFVDRVNHLLFRLNHMAKEDLVQLFYKRYNAERGTVLNQEDYVLEQRMFNGTNYLDLTSVSLSNVQVSIKGLSKRNILANSGFESGTTTGWKTGSGSAQLSVSTEQAYEGVYSLKAVKSVGELPSIIRQETPYRNGDTVTVSWYWKSNASVASALSLCLQDANRSYANVAVYSFNSSTSWTKYEVARTLYAANPFTLAFAFRFEAKNVTTYFDASLARIPETTSQTYPSPDDFIAYHPEFFDSTYFPGAIDTSFPSVTIAGQIVSHSGTLTNGTESTPTSLTEIITGAVPVSAVISGSGQAILRIKGTRLLYEDSTILRGRESNVYSGRYYGTFSPLTNINDLVAVTSLVSNITSLVLTTAKLNLTIDSPSGTTSLTQVYVGCRGKPESVSGVTDWSYDSMTGILTLNGTHSSPINVTLKWRLLGDVNRDYIVNSSDLVLFDKAYGAKSTDTNWNENCDFNNDGIIDVSDLTTLAKNYGKS